MRHLEEEELDEFVEMDGEAIDVECREVFPYSRFGIDEFKVKEISVIIIPW